MAVVGARLSGLLGRGRRGRRTGADRGVMSAVLVVSFLGAALLGVAAMGATSMRATKVLAGSCLALLTFVALVV